MTTEKIYQIAIDGPQRRGQIDRLPGQSRGGWGLTSMIPARCIARWD